MTLNAWRQLAIITSSLSVIAHHVRAAGPCHIDQGVTLTFYGAPDNTPANSNTIDAKCDGREGKPGGDGTFENPLTFAADDSTPYKHCDVIYLPYLQKYLIREDTCQACGPNHVDVWTGFTNTNGGKDQVECENKFTPGGTQDVIVNPPAGLKVDESPLYKGVGGCNLDVTHQGKASGDECNGSTGGDNSSPSKSTSKTPISPKLGFTTIPQNIVFSKSQPGVTCFMTCVTQVGGLKPPKSMAIVDDNDGNGPTQPKPSKAKSTSTSSPSGESQPSQGKDDKGCSWAGHCTGAPCKGDSDCADSLICSKGECVQEGDLLQPDNE